MVGELVAGPEGVDHDDLQVGAHEGEVVVASVPDEDVGLLLRLSHDRVVVDTGVDHETLAQVGLVVLPLLHGGLMAVQVVQSGETLHPLLHQVTVGHRMPDDDRPQSFGVPAGRRRTGRSGSCRPRCATAQTEMTGTSSADHSTLGARAG